MSDERDPQAHRIMELRRELDALRAKVERVEALTDLHAECGQFVAVWDLRRALDGDR